VSLIASLIFLLKTSVIPYCEVLSSTLSSGIVVGVLCTFGITLCVLFGGSEEVSGLLCASFGFVSLVRIADNAMGCPLFLFKERFRVPFKESD
jgi:hypothetical protein